MIADLRKWGFPAPIIMTTLIPEKVEKIQAKTAPPRRTVNRASAKPKLKQGLRKALRKAA